MSRETPGSIAPGGLGPPSTAQRLARRPVVGELAKSLEGLSRERIDDAVAQLALFRRLRDSGGLLQGGIDKKIVKRTAILEEIDSRHLTLRTADPGEEGPGEVLLTFQLDGVEYAFVATEWKGAGKGRAIVAVPRRVFVLERRDRGRVREDASRNDATRVELASEKGQTVRAFVADWSNQGMAVEAPASEFRGESEQVAIRYLNGNRAGEEIFGSIRNRGLALRGTGWTRIGLSVSNASRTGLIGVDRLHSIAPKASRRETLRSLGSLVQAASNRALSWRHRFKAEGGQVPVVEYTNSRGEPLRAIVDRVGRDAGAPAVVIPPAWGRTKETLWPLAATIVETFRQAGQPVSVIRFDGIRRRGESFIDPDCRTSGQENLRFTFSQGADDIGATTEFLQRDPRFRPSTIVLVTLSVAAVEGRRAIASDHQGRIGGWISVVGMADPQSALRTISGGIDYVYGLQHGMRFGLQEILGVVVDIDRVGLDGIQNHLVHLDDARRDMQEIQIPVTWIHARHDAWVDLGRVRDMLSCGDVTRRRLIEVPTGHQLRTSREAIGTFQLIASEVSRMALGSPLAPRIPDPTLLETRRIQERSRIPQVNVDLRRFWRDYLLGRDGKIGIDLVTATEAYRDFMRDQVTEMRLHSGDRIADLGAGTGALLRYLKESSLIAGIDIHAIDFVVAALDRARSEGITESSPLTSSAAKCVAADLNLVGERGIPIRSEVFSGAIGSLLVSYVAEPALLLGEIFRILRPGGRLVLSSMRRDSDISKLYVDSIQEMHAGRAREAFGEEIAANFDAHSRPFVNDAARLLELEEAGRFRFWDSSELMDEVKRAGFSNVQSSLSLGNPPQAVIVHATKR